MNIYVGNVPYAATEEDLEALFGEYGPVATATIIRDRYDGRSKGFGFVEMENQEDGERAIEALDGEEMMGRPLKVNPARDDQQKRSHQQDTDQKDQYDSDTTEDSFSAQRTGGSELSTRFHNPYTFVPTPPRPSNGFAGDFNPLKHGLDHASLKDGLWTGYIPIKLTTVTPLILIKSDDEDRSTNAHQTDVLDYLPESSLRGMLRSAYEVVTNSRYGCFSNDDRLAYRMDTDAALKLIPAVIENGNKPGTLKARLYPGTSFATDGGPNGARELGATYAAMLTRYSDRVRQSQCAANYTPETGDEVWAEIVLCQHEVSQRNQNYYSNDYRFWKVVMVWPKAGNPHAPAPTGGTPWYSNSQTPNRGRRQSYYAPIGPEDRRVVEGRVFITNENMGNKHDERIFFNPQSDTFDLDDLKEAWRMRIQSYRDAHTKAELFEREDHHHNNVKPWEKIGNNPGKTAWSPHLYQDGHHKDRWGRDVHDSLILQEGDMVYARCKFDKKTGDVTGITDLFPVMISRELYADSPADLLDCSLKPAKVRNELSPADRLFGWVPQEQGDDSGYKSRIRVVCDDGPRPDIVQRFDGDTLPLTILGQPKPAQGRFYVANNKGGPQHGDNKVAAGYDASQGKSLRGRKQYWHHKGLEAELTEDKQAECYWQPSTEDRTQVKRKGRYQEYRRPNDEDGNPQRDSQNRSIKGWIKPGTEFRVSLYVQNLQPEEVGALLWLLSLPEKHYFKLGYGKPLGFGSVTMEIDKARLKNGCLPLGTGEDWKGYYADLNACLPATLDVDTQCACIQKFQDSMVDAYDPIQANNAVDVESDDKKSTNLSFSDQLESIQSQRPTTPENQAQLIEQRFVKLSFIEGFKQVLKGPNSEYPIHYPRRNSKPNPEGKNYEWFMDNENGREYHEDGKKIALPAVTDKDGFPYNPSKPRQRRGRR